MSDWLTRPFLDSDREPLLYLLGVSYTRTRVGSSGEAKAVDHDSRAARLAEENHEPHIAGAE